MTRHLHGATPCLRSEQRLLNVNDSEAALAKSSAISVNTGVRSCNRAPTLRRRGGLCPSRPLRLSELSTVASRHGPRGAGAGLASVMEAAGIEPASVSRTDRASTSLSHLVISPGRLVVGNPPTGPAILRCRTFGDRVPSVPSPLLVAATRATGPARERRAQLLIRQRERVRCSCSHLCCSRGFTRPPGPRLAALPENRPRRNQVAPVCWAQCSRAFPRAGSGAR